MIVWTPAVLGVLHACALYFCICTCSAQFSMFHMERHSRNTLIIIIIIIVCKHFRLYKGHMWDSKEHNKCLGLQTLNFTDRAQYLL